MYFATDDDVLVNTSDGHIRIFDKNVWMIDISIITIQLIFNFFTINCVAAIDSEISDSSTLTWRLDIPPEDSEWCNFLKHFMDYKSILIHINPY